MVSNEFYLMSDEAILKALGERVSRHRLNRNATQAAVAREAGISRDTLSRAENGRVIDTQSLVRILRALDLLEGFSVLVPQPRVSPVALAQAQGRIRQRASGVRQAAPSDEPAGGAEWVWPDQDR